MYTITNLRAAAYKSKRKKNGVVLFATYNTVDIYTQEEEWNVFFRASDKSEYRQSAGKNEHAERLVNACIVLGVNEMEHLSLYSKEAKRSVEAKALINKLKDQSIPIDVTDVSPIMMSNEVALGAVEIDNELYVVSSVQWNGNHVRFWSKKFPDTIISNSSTITTRDAVSTCVRALGANDCEKATRDVMHSLVAIG